METTTIQDVNNFEQNNSNGNGGYHTEELAGEYAAIYCDWWGSNLVYLGCKQKEDGCYYPFFNVFD